VWTVFPTCWIDVQPETNGVQTLQLECFLNTKLCQSYYEEEHCIT